VDNIRKTFFYHIIMYVTSLVYVEYMKKVTLYLVRSNNLHELKY